MLLGGASCVLLAGCATTPRGEQGSVGVSQAQEEKLAAAHAHYAQGLIYELDEQPDKAMEELSQAALKDPSNEALVLDLARQYLQVPAGGQGGRIARQGGGRAGRFGDGVWVAG